jgi:hypothetical protein
LALGRPDADNAESAQLVRDIIVEAAKRGWMVYRAGTPYMDQVASLLDLMVTPSRDFTASSRAHLTQTAF